MAGINIEKFLFHSVPLVKIQLCISYKIMIFLFVWFLACVLTGSP